mmetsp:Transcript_10710/g.15112  ORF Transcript_10710/g.15112 Transcript_10710/m.15112 type:complete len:626 (+) Transcript_10710:1-1878(+)
MKIQLLAKFLGMLTFCSHWNLPGRSMLTSKVNTASDSRMLEAPVPDLPLRNFIEIAWKERRLVVVIPWVIEFLRMSTMDRQSFLLFTFRSSYYEEIFGLLRSYHKKLSTFQSKQSYFYNFNVTFLVSYLETFFSDVVGLEETENIPLFHLPVNPARFHENAIIFDDSPLNFSWSFVTQSSTHLDELRRLTSDLLHHDGRIPSCNGALKKLKPQSVILEHPHCSEMNVNNDLKSVRAIHHRQNLNMTKKRLDSERSKLIESFFHNHKDIEILCEFVVDVSVKNASSIMGTNDISDIIEDSFLHQIEDHSKAGQPIGMHARSYYFERIIDDVLLVSHEIMKYKCSSYIYKSIPTLIAPDMDEQIKYIAESLAVEHAHKKIRKVIFNLLNAETKKRVDDYFKIFSISENMSIEDVEHKFTSKIDQQKCTLSQNISNLNQILTSKVQAIQLGQLQSIDLSEDFLIEVETTNRIICNFTKTWSHNEDQSIRIPFILMNELVQNIFTSLKVWLKDSNRRYWPNGMIHMITLSSTLGLRFLPLSSSLLKLGTLFLENLETIISWKSQVDVQNKNQKGDCILEAVSVLLKARIISTKDTYEALLDILDSEISQQVAKSCFSIIAFLDKSMISI